MNEIADVLRYLAAASLGVYTGCMLTEGGVLVPYWRSLPARQFFDWYAANDSRLFKFFGRVTETAAIAVVAASIASFLSHDPARWASAVAAMLMLACVAMFPFYFQGANSAFAAGTMSPAELETELARWASRHRLRTAIAMVAFAAAMMACRNA